MKTQTANVVIVGGGFGGVKAALELAKQPDARITLISDKENFIYYPSLYSTATGHSYRESWAPLTAIFADTPNVKLVYDHIVSIDPTKHTLRGSADTPYRYGKLILALGNVTTYFGIEGLDAYSFGIKSEEEIRRLQTHLYEEMSDGSDDEANYVVVGAGPTGVELAGALGEYIIKLREHFHIRKKRVRISLIEGADRVLPRLSPASSGAAHRRLRQLGVRVELNKRVEKRTADELIVNGKPLKTGTVIWTSGVAVAPFYKNNEQWFTFDSRGRVMVDEYLQARNSVYVIGDNAATPHSGLAQTALHDGHYVAHHLMGNRKPYAPKLPPCVIPIGRHWAVFEWGKLHFSGRVAHWLHTAAGLIGHDDVLPLGWAIGSWRAGKKSELRLPEDLTF